MKKNTERKTSKKGSKKVIVLVGLAFIANCVLQSVLAYKGALKEKEEEEKAQAHEADKAEAEADKEEAVKAEAETEDPDFDDPVFDEDII